MRSFASEASERSESVEKVGLLNLGGEIWVRPWSVRRNRFLWEFYLNSQWTDLDEILNIDCTGVIDVPEIVCFSKFWILANFLAPRFFGSPQKKWKNWILSKSDAIHVLGSVFRVEFKFLVYFCEKFKISKKISNFWKKSKKFKFFKKWCYTCSRVSFSRRFQIFGLFLRKI